MASHHNTNILAAEQTHGIRGRALPRVPNCCAEKEKLHAVQLRWEKYAELQSSNSLLSYHILAADTFKTQADWSAMMDDYLCYLHHVSCAMFPRLDGRPWDRIQLLQMHKGDSYIERNLISM